MNPSPTDHAGWKPKIENGTPLDLKLIYEFKDRSGELKERREKILRSLETDSCEISLPGVESIAVTVLVHWGAPVGRFEVRRPDAGLLITPERLDYAPAQAIQALRNCVGVRMVWDAAQKIWRSETNYGEGPCLTFNNATDIYVDLYYAAAEQHKAFVATLPPGGTHQGFYPHFAWMARAAFTGELLSMFMPVPAPQQTFTIGTEFRDRKAAALQKWVPSPFPDFPNVCLVGQKSEDSVKLDPKAEDFQAKAEFEALSLPYFNGLPDLALRSVKISGVQFSSEELPLSDYRAQGGKNLLDMQSLELYADSIVISSVLRFPGTDVTIYARALEFKSGGRIVTTPMNHLTPAVTPAEDRNANGTPKTYIAADGLDGQQGGRIKLFVKHLKTPPTEPDVKRFVAHGSRGQQAEPGGHKLYTKGVANQPENTKDLDAVTKSWIEKELKVTCDFWRWPGEVRNPDDIGWNSQKLFGTTQTRTYPNGDTITTISSSVTSLKINAFDLRVITPILGGAMGSNRTKSISWPPQGATCPGNGESAYQGGLPGAGGTGGHIKTNLPLEIIHRLCDVSAGAPGPETPAVKGKVKGTPDPAFHVEMDIVNFDSLIAAPRKPALTKVTQFNHTDGSDAPARKGKEGAAGGISQESTSWMHPDALDALLACARDAYRNEDRKLASALLEPYYGELRFSQDVEMKSRYAEISALRNRLISNVDYYGNPPGWVPRLNLRSTFDIFESVQSISTSLLYYALNMEEKYDKLWNANQLAAEMSDAIALELNHSMEQLKTSFTGLANARLKLEELQDAVGLQQNRIDLLKAEANREAEGKVLEQRVFRGVMKTIGGMMKVCPIGQPYLGLGGDITSGIGDFNWNDPGGVPKQIGSVLGQIGKTTDAFLEKNKDLIKADAVPEELRTRLKLSQASGTSLEGDLDVAKAVIADQETTLAAEQDRAKREWAQSAETKRMLEKLTAELAAVVKKIDEHSKEAELLTLPEAELRKRLLLKSWLESPRAASLREQKDTIEQAVKEVEREKEIAAKNFKKEAQEKLDDEVKMLRGLKRSYGDLEIRSKQNSRQTKGIADAIKERETKVGATLDRLKGVGSGVSMIGEGIASFATVKDDDSEVKRLAADILNSTKGPQYNLLLKEFTSLAKQQNDAMAKLTRLQSEMDSGIASISRNLAELNALSRQRQSQQDVLDVRLRRYLKDMRSRAIENLRRAIYDLVMAYRYEYLKDVSKDFYNIDKVVERLRKLDASSNDDSGPLRIWKVDRERFKAPEKAVLSGEFLKMAIPLIEQRQRVAGLKENTLPCRLDDKQREELRIKGRVTFNLVRDLQLGSFFDRNERIVYIADLKLTIKTKKPWLNLRAVFWHSGESIIRSADREQKCYYFRSAPEDDPIFWGFNWSYGFPPAGNAAPLGAPMPADPAQPAGATAGGGPLPARPDTVPGENDEFLQILLANAAALDPSYKSKTIKYSEYLPSHFSDITLVLTHGDEGADGGRAWNAELLSEITEVGFTVKHRFNATAR